jgi:hypothetical protein
MPEPSKYGKALSALKQASAPPARMVTTPAPDLPAPPLPEPTPKAGRGGKRSDPEYTPTTFFVRKVTKRKAARLLEDTNAEQDLSDLVEHLLAKWVAEHSHV